MLGDKFNVMVSIAQPRWVDTWNKQKEEDQDDEDEEEEEQEEEEEEEEGNKRGKRRGRWSSMDVRPAVEYWLFFCPLCAHLGVRFFPEPKRRLGWIKCKNRKWNKKIKMKQRRPTTQHIKTNNNNNNNNNNNCN